VGLCVHCRRTPDDIAPANCQQTWFWSELAAASRGFLGTAWLSCSVWLWVMGCYQEICTLLKIDALAQWSLQKLLRIKCYHNVQN